MVFPSFKTWRFYGLNTLEYATYNNCLCEKFFFQMYACHLSVCLWILIIIIANAVFAGNYALLNLNGKFFENIGLGEIKTFSPFAVPVIIIDIIHSRCFICRVPLHVLGESRLRIDRTGTQTFSLSLLESTPDNSKELRNRGRCYLFCFNDIVERETLRGVIFHEWNNFVIDESHSFVRRC